MSLVCALGATGCDESADDPDVSTAQDAGDVNGGDASDVGADAPLDVAADGSGGDAGDGGVDADADAAPDAPTTAWTQPPAWCDDAPPDDTCFALARDARSSSITLAVEIADKFIEDHAAESLAWNWTDAVMLVGVARLAKVVGDPLYYRYIGAYLDHHIAEGYRIATSDTSAPAALAVEMIAAGYDTPEYRTIVDDALTYYFEEARRTEDGGLSHFGTVALLEPELWADSLFMFGNVMTGWGAQTDDVELLDAYAEQVAIFADAMQEESGFFKHAAYSAFEQEPDVYWARANGWILAAVFDHLSARLDDGVVPQRVLDSVVALADAVLATQDAETGLWFTVVNRPGETYVETSASALFAYGLARGVRYGVLDEAALENIESAMQGVVDQVRRDDRGRPIVGGISGPTNVGTFANYAGISVADDIAYGLGAVLLALTETSGLDIELELTAPGVPGEVVPVTFSEDLEGRRMAFYDECVSRNAEAGGVYGQSCRVAAGLPVYEAPIDAALTKLTDRLDTSDFTANGLVRLLYLDDETGALGDVLRTEIEDVMFGFKYWLTEPGEDSMAYWTENHQILFHAAEYLIGQRYPDMVFSNSGMTGTEHMEHARPRLIRWMQMRGRYGFSEWHSNVYFNEDIPPLLNLFDFADDAELVAGAEVVLDLLSIDLAANMYNGLFATTAGRTKASKFVGNPSDSTQDYAYIALGNAEPRSFDNFAGAFMATSTYAPPAAIETLAFETEIEALAAGAGSFEHRQRDSWDVEEGPRIGVSYEGIDDIVLWAGQSTLTHPDMINGAFAAIDEYDLFGGFLFDQLPPAVINLLRSMAGTPRLPAFAWDLEPLALGLGLETIDTYVYRTPDYQLAAAQDWKPGYWAAQTLVLRATLGDDVAVTTWGTGPLGGGLVGDDPPLDDLWVGGWLPRVTAHHNVAVSQFTAEAWNPVIDQVVAREPIRAYFPVDLMDEWEQRDGWLFGRVGEGYVALWSSEPLTQLPPGTDTWQSPSVEGVFVLELGRSETNGTFAEFVEAVASATLTVTPTEGVGADVAYNSPSLGEVTVGWTGPMQVAGASVDVGPYDRVDNDYVRQRRGQATLDVRTQDAVLRLDFDAFTRTQFASPSAP